MALIPVHCEMSCSPGISVCFVFPECNLHNPGQTATSLLFFFLVLFVSKRKNTHLKISIRIDRFFSLFIYISNSLVELKILMQHALSFSMRILQESLVHTDPPPPPPPRCMHEYHEGKQNIYEASISFR